LLVEKWLEGGAFFSSDAGRPRSDATGRTHRSSRIRGLTAGPDLNA
jgi:hypothetical protein